MEWQSAQIVISLGVFVVAVIGGLISYGRLQGKINEVEARLNDFRKDIREDIKELRNSLQEINKNILSSLNKPTLIQRKSPIVLTDSGRDIAKDINADNLVNQYGGLVEIKPDASQYQIQEACFEFAEMKLRNLLKDPDKEIVEKIAYKKGITVEEILKVVGVKLRDDLLKKHGMSPPE